MARGALERIRTRRARSLLVGRTAAGCAPLIVLGAAPLGGCMGPGLLTDGTSVSVGRAIDGVLRGGAQLPLRGEGFVVPERWRARGRHHGTDELVGLIIKAAHRVRAERPGATLGVADLSAPGGGAIEEHYTHASGRDVDLLFFAVDTEGAPTRANAMLRFGCDGRSRPRAAGLRFDTARNWALVKALVLDRVDVEWIFIARHLSAHLLRHARRIGVSPEIRHLAAWTMHQPGNANAHDGHLHVRVFCSSADRAQGCRNRVPARWRRYQELFGAKERRWPLLAEWSQEATRARRNR